MLLTIFLNFHEKKFSQNNSNLLISLIFYGQVNPHCYPIFTEIYLRFEDCHLLKQGRATIFVCGPHLAFLGALQTRFQSKSLLYGKKFALRGPDVARGPYVAPSCVKGIILKAIFFSENQSLLMRHFRKEK
jgi:hypothetical protein